MPFTTTARMCHRQPTRSMHKTLVMKSRTGPHWCLNCCHMYTVPGVSQTTRAFRCPSTTSRCDA